MRGVKNTNHAQVQCNNYNYLIDPSPGGSKASILIMSGVLCALIGKNLVI